MQKRIMEKKNQVLAVWLFCWCNRGRQCWLEWDYLLLKSTCEFLLGASQNFSAMQISTNCW